MKRTLRSLLRAYTGTPLIARITCGIVTGTILALICPELDGIDTLGMLFVGALKSIAPILVALLVTASVAKVGTGLGARFGTVIALYITSTLIAALIAVAASQLFPVQLTLTGMSNTRVAAPDSLDDVTSNLLLLFITNPVEAVSSASYLSVLFWSIIMGLALKQTASTQTICVIHQLANAVSLVIKWIGCPVRCSKNRC